MSPLLQGEPLIYERANGVVYAHYRDPPHNQISRWVVGGTPEGFARAQGNLFSYSEWEHMMRIAKTNSAFKIQLDRLVLMYYTIKDEEDKKKPQ